jgi:5'-3' exonuclease
MSLMLDEATDFPKTKNIILVDFSWVLNRAYYAIFDKFSFKVNGVETPTGDIYGVLREIGTMEGSLDDLSIVLCLDSPKAAQNRASENEDYKSNREKNLEIYKKFQEILISASMLPNVYISAYPSCEGDDIIYTLAQRFANTDKQVLIFSRDRDLYQSITSDNIKVFFKLESGKGIELYGKEVTQKDFLGVDPEKLTFFRSLAGGDSGDNLKGYSRFQKKIALDIVNNFKTPIDLIEAIHSDSPIAKSIIPDRLSQMIKEDPDRLIKNYECMTLKPIEGLKVYKGIGSWDFINLYGLTSIFNRYNSIIQKLS